MIFNPFASSAPFPYPLKTSENFTVFWCFWGGRERVHWDKWVKQKTKISEHEIKINLKRKRVSFTPSVKYLGVKIDKNLNWHHHINDLAAKLNRATIFLFKIRNYFNQGIYVFFFIRKPFFCLSLNFFNILLEIRLRFS